MGLFDIFKTKKENNLTYARMLSGRMTKEEFKRWADHARQLRKDCYEDKISAETFIELMKNP